MARISVIGSIARDEIVAMREPLREGCHLEGRFLGPRLGGGGACTAVPLAWAGHEVCLFAGTGDDAASDHLLAELAATGVDASQIARCPGGPTRSMIMIDPDGERTILNLERVTQWPMPASFLEHQADCVYVRSRALDLADLLTRKARTSRVVAHIPPIGAGARPAHVLIGSESDLGADFVDQAWRRGREIAGDLLEWVVLTHGEEGASAIRDGKAIHVPARPVQAVDTTGAGDAFAAGMVHGLVSGVRMDRALEIATRWGAAAVASESSVLPAEAVRRLA